MSNKVIGKISPLTTKGDIETFSTVLARLGVGSDGQVLSADSTQTTGLKWVTAGLTQATPTALGTTTSYFSAIQSAVKTTSIDYTVLTTDGYLIVLVTTGSSTITITLPAASANGGRRLIIKKVDSGTGKIAVARAGSDTIDGFTSVNIGVGTDNQYSSISLACDGSALWAITSQSEIVAASYYASASGSASTTAPINFDTKLYDTHSAVTTGASWKFTAPTPGVYTVSGAYGSSTGHFFKIYKNGTIFIDVGAASDPGDLGRSSVDVKLSATETIEIRPDTAVTYLGGSLTGADTACQIYIKKNGTIL